jgi:hypothetical protein
MHKFEMMIKSFSIFDWECIMLGLATFFIPFHNIHEFLNIRFMGEMGNKLSIYPILIGICLFLYQHIKKEKVYVPPRIVLFFIVFFVWQFISLVHGLFVFPGWHDISVNQFKKLEFLLSFFEYHGIIIEPVIIGRIWWSFKLILPHVLGYCVTYGAALWAISLFYKNREVTFRAFRYGILGGAVICSAYSIIEFFYLFGSYDAMTILAYINPFIYDVGGIHGWWPPLLGGNRVRSMFAEPAYMALYLTVTIPFVFAQIYTAKAKKWFWKILFAMQLLMMWGTNSKTALGILLAEGLAVVVFLFLRRKRIAWKQLIRPILAIIILCGVGMGMNWIFQHRYAVDYELVSITHDDTVTLKITNKSYTVWEEREGIDLTSAWFTDDWKDEYGRINVPLNTTLLPGQSCEVSIKLPEPDSKELYPNVILELEANNAFQKKVRLLGQGATTFTLHWSHNHWLDKGESKVKENKMTALTSQTEGSNQQRYGLMYVETLIGRDHPIFGVGGQELKQAYIPEYIPDWLKGNKEVRLWLFYQKTKGVYNLGFPILSDYTHQFSSYGLLGFILYLIPSFYGLFLLINKRKLWLLSSTTEYMRIAILSISYFGLMASFIGCNSFETYIYWLLLSVLLGYCGTLGCNFKS